MPPTPAPSPNDETQKLKKRNALLEAAIEKIADAVDPRPEVTMRLNTLVASACKLIEEGKKAGGPGSGKEAAIKPPPPIPKPEAVAPAPPPAPPSAPVSKPKAAAKPVVPASDIDLSPARFAGITFGDIRTPITFTFSADLGFKGGERFWYSKDSEWLRVVGCIKGRPKFNVVCASSRKLERAGEPFKDGEMKVFAKEFVMEKVFGSATGGERRAQRIRETAAKMGLSYEDITKPFRMIINHSVAVVTIFDINETARKHPIVVECPRKKHWVINKTRLEKNLEHNDSHTVSPYERALESCHGRSRFDFSDFDPADLRWIGEGCIFMKPSDGEHTSDPERMDLIDMGVYPKAIKGSQGSKRPRE